MTMTSDNSVAKRVPSIDRLTRLYIDGEFVDPRSGEVFERVSPVSGERLPDLAAAGQDDVDEVVRRVDRAITDLETKRRIH